MAESKGGEEVKSTDLDVTKVQVLGNAKIVSKFAGTSPAMSCAVFPKNLLIATGWSDGVIQIRKTSETFEEINTLGRSSDVPTTSMSACEPDDGKQVLLSSSASGETKIWDVVEGTELWKVAEDRQSLVNGFSCDHSLFAVGGSDAKISVFDLSHQKLVQLLQGSMDPNVMDGHTLRVFSLRFHPTRKDEIISGGWDDTIQFWDLRESFSRRKIRGPHICGDGIEFLDDNRFITASWRKKNPLQIWDYRNEKLIDDIKPDDLTCFLYCCRHVESESILLAGGSHKNMLRVIDLKTFKSLATFSDLPGAVYFAKDLPKEDSISYTTTICFCSESAVYVADIEI